MITETIAGIAITLIGGLGFKNLNGRINRVEDKCDRHLETITKEVTEQGKGIAAIEAIVQRIEKHLNGES